MLTLNLGCAIYWNNNKNRTELHINKNWILYAPIFKLVFNSNIQNKRNTKKRIYAIIIYNFNRVNHTAPILEIENS